MQPQGAACNLSFSYETGIFYQGLYYTALTPDFKTTVTKRGLPPPDASREAPRSNRGSGERIVQGSARRHDLPRPEAWPINLKQVLFLNMIVHCNEFWMD